MTCDIIYHKATHSVDALVMIHGMFVYVFDQFDNIQHFVFESIGQAEASAKSAAAATQCRIGRRRRRGRRGRGRHGYSFRLIHCSDVAPTIHDVSRMLFS
jgi:hypothetical protein